MSEAVKLATIPPGRGGRRAPILKPTDEHREIVELLAAFGVSYGSICTELARRGLPCRSPDTLVKRFGRELQQGKDRLTITLGRRMMALAMGDGPHAFQACRYLLVTRCGEGWREPKDNSETEPAPPSTGALIYPKGDLTRELPPEPPTIDGELEPEGPSSRTTIDI